MQFVIIASDATDADAINRRLKARDAHTKAMTEGRKNGNMIAGAALLDDNGQMNGSVIIVDFASREALDNWLKTEAYITGKVWGDVEIIPCKLGPTFSDLLIRKD